MLLKSSPRKTRAREGWILGYRPLLLQEHQDLQPREAQTGDPAQEEEARQQEHQDPDQVPGWGGRRLSAAEREPRGAGQSADADLRHRNPEWDQSHLFSSGQTRKDQSCWLPGFQQSQHSAGL